MKVALVHDFLNQIGGGEKVLQSFHELFPKAPVFTLTYDPEETHHQFDNYDIRPSFIQKLPGGVKHYKWWLRMMPAAIEHLDLSKYDLILSDSSSFAKGVIPRTNALHICYCHTPTRFLWSDAHSYTEELNQSSIIKKIIPLVLNKLRVWDKEAASRVDSFIANSRYVAKRIKKYYQRDSTVIYPPVETSGYPEETHCGAYYLIVSRLRPYKKVDLAIEAFNALQLPLKIIGIGEEFENLKNISKPNIEFLGKVSDEEKKRLLANCRAFIHPQEEDFGISAVEAMAAGRPVIAYRVGGALETVKENETGLFFKEQTPWSLVDVIRENHDRMDQFDSTKIRIWAYQFNPESFKNKIKEFVYKAYQDYNKVY